MKTHRWEDIKTKRRTPAQLAALDRRVEQKLLELDLRAMRELAGRTQEDVASAAEMEQSEVSRLERRQDCRLSTLRRYVKALGGDLEVVAIFGDRRLRLRTIG